MSMSFRSIVNDIWKSHLERAPLFYRIIGIENEDEYNNILKFLYEKAIACDTCIFFANEIAVSSDFNMISSVSSELSRMDLYNLNNVDIIMFDDRDTNTMFLTQLDMIVKKIEFKNTSIKIDFIVKMILWIYDYVRPMQDKLNNSFPVNCIYYGDITDHEKYFLVLLHLMGFNVLYINPLRDDMKAFSDTVYSSDVINSQRISSVGNIMDRINSAKGTTIMQSTTAQLMDEIQENIFNNGYVFRAWQLKDYDIETENRKITIYDLQNNINEPAKIREGFEVCDKVKIPNIFFQVDGVPDNIEEYIHLFDSCVCGEHHILFEDCGLSLIQNTLTEDEKLQLVFCKSTSDSYDINELRKIQNYTWDKYNEHVEKKLIEALNKTLQHSVFNHKLKEDIEFSLIDHILSISMDIIKLLDNYDYSEEIPKIILFLNNEDFLIDEAVYMLAFLHELGFDIVIFNPSGLKSISSIINPDIFSSHRFDKMVYDLTLNKLRSKKKPKGFFSFLFQ